MIILKAQNISKAFGQHQIIDNFSFEVNSGEIVVLEGRSGTGKTTLMRIINNLEIADGGSLSVDNHVLFKDGVYSSKEEILQYQLSVGMVFQNFALFPHLSVYENLCVAPKFLKITDNEQLRQRAKQLLRNLDIEEKIDDMPSTLSGGQKQRVAVARSIMLEPKLICFDEPTSALDRDLTASVMDIIKDLKQRGMGVFIISHDTDFAQSIADKLLHSRDFIT